MSEMIDRVAKGIFHAEYGDQSYTFTKTEFLEYKRMAEGAIKAMREPTEEMMKVWGELLVPFGEYKWKQMIDAALEGK